MQLVDPGVKLGNLFFGAGTVRPHDVQPPSCIKAKSTSYEHLLMKSTLVDTFGS
jgi:hypothetical protein